MEATTDPFVRSVYAELALLMGGPKGRPIGGVSYLTKRLGYDRHRVGEAVWELARLGALRVEKGPGRNATVRVMALTDPPVGGESTNPLEVTAPTAWRPEHQQPASFGAVDTDSYGLGRRTSRSSQGQTSMKPGFCGCGDVASETVEGVAYCSSCVPF